METLNVIIAVLGIAAIVGGATWALSRALDKHKDATVKKLDEHKDATLKKLDELKDAFAAHALDDANHFSEVRGQLIELRGARGRKR